MPFESRGQYFDDLELGAKVITAGRTVTESDVMLFAGVTGDWTNIHIDREAAKSMMFGERVAHGLLVLGMGAGLAMQRGFLEGTVEAFMGLDWKFTAPVKFGDTIHAEIDVAQKKAMGPNGIVVFSVAILNQNGETVQKGKWTVLVRARPQS
jgi:3-hydroxybutyryl-CoA dehydratase